jgi:hypothetical protein
MGRSSWYDLVELVGARLAVVVVAVAVELVLPEKARKQRCFAHL